MPQTSVKHVCLSPWRFIRIILFFGVPLVEWMVDIVTILELSYGRFELESYMVNLFFIPTHIVGYVVHAFI